MRFGLTLLVRPSIGEALADDASSARRNRYNRAPCACCSGSRTRQGSDASAFPCNAGRRRAARQERGGDPRSGCLLLAACSRCGLLCLFAPQLIAAERTALHIAAEDVQLTFLCTAITAGFALCHGFPPSPFYLVQAPATGPSCRGHRAHPNLLKVPGVRGVTRMAGEPFAMSIGGAEKQDTMCLSPLFRRAAVDKASRPSLRISFVRCGCLSR